MVKVLLLTIVTLFLAALRAGAFLFNVGCLLSGRLKDGYAVGLRANKFGAIAAVLVVVVDR